MKPQKISKRVKTGRYFMTAKQMREAKWYESVINSCIKRGEMIQGVRYQCSCGCGVA
jgi:hypothetical protein